MDYFSLFDPEWRERMIVGAIIESDIQTVRDNIPYVDVNKNITANDESFMLLHVAAAEGASVICRLLIERGAYVDALDKSGLSALHIAALQGYSDVVSELIKGGCSVDLPDEGKGASALIVASGQGHREIVSLLIQKGANINCSDDEGRTALICATEEKRINVLSLLISKKANVNSTRKDGASALHLAVQDRQTDIVSLLIKGGANVNLVSPPGAPLHIAADRGYTETISILIQGGADVNILKIGHVSALHFAALNGFRPAVQELLKNGAAVDIRMEEGITPLHLAVQKRHIDVVSALLRSGANVNLKLTNGSNALHMAVVDGYVNLVSELINFKADIDIIGHHDWGTALNIAAANGNVDIINLLLNSGASKFFTEDGYSVLQCAVYSESMEAIKLLHNFLSKKLHRKIVDALEYSALILAVAVENWDILHYFCDFHPITKDLVLESVSCLPSPKIFAFLCKKYIGVSRECEFKMQCSPDDVFQTYINTLMAYKRIIQNFSQLPDFHTNFNDISCKVSQDIRYYTNLQSKGKTFEKYFGPNKNIRKFSPKPHPFLSLLMSENEDSSFMERVFRALHLRQQVGRGSFGIIYKTVVKTLRNSDVVVAVKQIELKLNHKFNLEDVMSECKKIKLLRHKNIVHLHGVIYKRPDLWIVMELCDQDLKTFFIDDGLKNGNNPGLLIGNKTYSTTIKFVLKIMLQICDGLAYIHSKKCIHKDLKLANIMLKGSVVKICDFGLSDFIKGDVEYSRQVKGTPNYLAPECFNGIYSVKSDCYVLGLMFYEIWFGELFYKHPIFDGKNVVELIRNEIRPPFESIYNPPKMIRKFIEACFAHKAIQRPDATECKRKIVKVLKVVETALPKKKKAKF